jgi:3,4-dihydroxy-2-butanone 4-phosphate synthase
MNDDGTMARGPQLTAFCRRHSLPLVTVEDVAAHMRSLQPAFSAA